MEQPMSGLPENDTPRPRLPLPLQPAGPRPSLARSQASAAFLSQLLAMRERRPELSARALGAYGRTASSGERRMPQGFRKSVLA